mgnify:CR=1 FL=1
MYKKFLYITSVVLVVFSNAASAEMIWSFKSPAFHYGNGYSSHVLSVEQLQHNRKQDLKDKAEAEAKRLERELENVYLTAQVDSSIQLADDLAAPSASKDNDGDYFDAIGSDAAHGNTLSGKTIFSNQSLPSYTNRASATTAITVANGASAGDTYLYYNSSNFQIEGVRL